MHGSVANETERRPNRRRYVGKHLSRAYECDTVVTRDLNDASYSQAHSTTNYAETLQMLANTWKATVASFLAWVAH